ncbi:MAG TPA: hypothetical protein VGJ20_31465 [Xanthobacteraceae bacterium]|jgi:hypothetical protein
MLDGVQPARAPDVVIDELNSRKRSGVILLPAKAQSVQWVDFGINVNQSAPLDRMAGCRDK